MKQSVLNSWIFLESIYPAELDKKKLKQKVPAYMFEHNQVEMTMRPYHLLSKPWERLSLKSKKFNIKYRYYIGSYSLDELAKQLRLLFQIDEEMYTSIKKEGYSYLFEVDSRGKYIENSLFIPHLQLILKDLSTSRTINYGTFESRYLEAKTKLEEELNVIFSQSVSPAAIEELNNRFFYHFSSVRKKDKVNGYMEIIIQKKEDHEDSTAFNSFYLNDLTMIARKGMNYTLARYIEGEAELRIDIDENRDQIEKILDPMNLPLGRWPAKHRLSLMQQVAINSIVNGKETVNSVNGPPGTGKTTMLKDLFSEFMVQRSMKMVAFDNPQEAFQSIGQISLNNSILDIYELDNSIASYKMVVASSNNGAVENISKDLPKENEMHLVKDNEDDMFGQAFNKEYEKLDLHKEIAELIIEDNAWGMFSAPLGKVANLDNVAKKLQGIPKKDSQEKLTSISERLITRQEKAIGEWAKVKNSFLKLVEEITKEQKQLTTYIKLSQQIDNKYKKLRDEKVEYSKLEFEFTEITEQYRHVQAARDSIIKTLELLPSLPIRERITNWIFRRRHPELAKLLQAKQSKEDTLNQLAKRKIHYTNAIKQLNTSIKQLEKQISNFKLLHDYYASQRLIHSTEDYWSPDSYEHRQSNVIWQTDKLNILRGRLFIKALRVHQVFNEINANSIDQSLQLFYHRKELTLNDKQNRRQLQAMWNVLHLIIPVVSTTFASFSSMYRGIEQDFIDYLFIDEAGQARPQEAAGAMWRSKRAIVVGDPIQIEPVVTMHETLLKDIRTNFSIPHRYMSKNTSVQVLSDHANPLGTWKENGENKQRIGVPLWVHRRCVNPIFSIANEIAYNGKMVLGKDGHGKCEWFNVTGRAIKNQFVHEQGEFLINRLKHHIEKEESILSYIYIITPFTMVANELRQLIKKTIKANGYNMNKWVDKHVGTVHTFQGKEADIVYFVTGTDYSQEGAANWSCHTPNLINVAVTRAKYEFYVIGDKTRYKDKPYYSTIIQHESSSSQAN